MREWIKNLDCMIDLHLHLDGAISLASAKQLAEMQGIALPDSDGELLKRMRVSADCSDLNEFLEKFDFPCSLLQTEDAIRQAVVNLMTELKEQGVLYAEIRFAPQKSTDRGLTQEQVVAAAAEGLREAPLDGGLILCCMRGNDNFEENAETVRVAGKYLGKGVVAVDLAGAEALFPTESFRELFASAKEKNIPFTLHAGEADGPASVWAALQMGPVRIGHGVRSLEDRELVRQLAELQIPLELCPTSNVCTAMFGSIREWPLPELLDSGMLLTVNTDDPSIEGTTIHEEYEKLADCFAIGKKEVKALLCNGVRASFADEELKKQLLTKIDGALKGTEEGGAV